MTKARLAYPYAVVTDGRLAIGLHQHALPQSPLLAFVLPNLGRQLEALEAAGVMVLDRRLGSDVFNEASFEAPGGQLVRLLEARTFSPAPRAPGDLTSSAGSRKLRWPVATRGDRARLGAVWLVPAEEGGNVSARRAHERPLNVALVDRATPDGPC